MWLVGYHYSCVHRFREQSLKIAKGDKSKRLAMSNSELGANILAAVGARIEENNKRSCINLQELIRSTQFSKQEIKCMYRGFKQVS